MKDLDYLAKTPNAYIFINGDLLNAAIRHSVSDVHGEGMTVKDARHFLQAKLEPVRDKVIGVLSGNHDGRIYKHTGEDSIDALCAICGIWYADSGEADIKLSFGRYGSSNSTRYVNYGIYAVHGWGGGKTWGAKANNLMSLRVIRPNADLYVFSHTHTPMVIPDVTHAYDIGSGAILEQHQLFVMTPAYMERAGYAIAQGFKPQRKGCIRVKLSGRVKKMTALV
jgi:hypothetical protein